MTMTALSRAKLLAIPQCSVGNKQGGRLCGTRSSSPSHSLQLAACLHSSSLVPRLQSLRSEKFSLKTTRRPALGRKSVTCEASKVAENSVSVILLAGGVGKRMGAAIPKQYLPLREQPIATFSLQTFSGMEEVGEVVVVCDPSWQYIFEETTLARDIPLKFALPGDERQDSVFNGLQEAKDDAALVCVHDSARPLVTTEEVTACLEDAAEVGAAVLAVQTKATIKEVGSDGMVVKTLVRSRLWEMHTPQVIRPALLKEGFAYVKENQLEVTDDVSIVEHLNRPVKITKGSYENLKVTTPEDLLIAERLLDDRAAKRAEAKASA